MTYAARVYTHGLTATDQDVIVIFSFQNFVFHAYIDVVHVHCHSSFVDVQITFLSLRDR